MSELVLMHHNEPMTTSLAVAACTENEHDSVILLIRKYADHLKEFGELVFQVADPGISRFEISDRIFEIENSRDKRGRPTEFAWLNEGQSTFLITLMRNSEIVVKFKIALVKAFFELRDRLKTAQPTFTTTNLGHGADLAVAADRTFRGFLRSARASGLRLPQALQVANRQTIARTGMDMLSELGVTAEDQADPAVPEDSIDRFLSAWLRGETRYPCTPCKSGDLFSAYRQWCREMDERAAYDTEFHKRSAHFTGIRKAFAQVDGRNARVVVPDCDIKPEGWTVARWVAVRASAFKESMTA